MVRDKTIMRPIRNVEYDHWNYTIDETYDDRKSSLKTEMIDEIDDLSEDNYEAFKAKLKLDKVIKDIEVKYHDYNDFVKNKKAIEEQKSNDLNRAIDQMYDILQKFNKERKWKTDVEHSMLKDPKDHDILLKKLCREETEKAYYAGPKGRALQLLDISKKKSKHVLNSGLPLDLAVKSISMEMASQKINLDLPKDMFNPSIALEHKK
tara:strand:- start:1104 stop:1724 length:621 start_codon:yes stop_codon:yes gene_type:complete